MSMTPPGHEAFLLLTLANVQLTCGNFSQRDVLALECLTVPDAPPGARDVFLVLRLGSFEAAVDPERHVSVTLSNNGDRTYTFRRTSSEATEIILRVPGTGEKRTQASADVDTFDGILEQYANFRHGAHIEPTSDGAAFKIQDAQQDLRGKLVLVDQDNGEVLGAVGDEQAHVHAEAGINRPGHEHDAVYIDVPEDGELDPQELFVRVIPPGEHNFVTRGASMLSTGISGAATLLTRGMTTASNAYISRAVPHPSASPTKDGSPPTLPPRPVQWMTSDEGKKRMQTVHAATGKAVVVSNKTMTAVEGIIRRMVGGAQVVYDKGKARAVAPSPNSPYAPSPAASYATANSPYGPNSSAYAPSGGLTPTYGTPGGTPRGGSPQPPAYRPTPGKLITSDAQFPSSQNLNASPTDPSPKHGLPPSYAWGRTPPPVPSRKGDDKLDTKDRIVLSANLIIGTLGKSAKQVMDVGSDRLSAVVGHKYGAEAGQSTRVLTGTVRNVGLVYVDVTGLGRRALLKTAGKEYVKARIKGRKYKLRTDTNGEVVQAEPATPMVSPRLK